MLATSHARVPLQGGCPSAAIVAAQVRISVVTVAFNAEETIGATLASLVGQSYPHWESLVIDGGSTDQTVEIANSFADPRIKVSSEPDRGIYDAMNKGLRRFAGDAVGFLNADDSLHGPDALASIAEALMRNGVVHGHLDFLRGGEVVRRWRATEYRRGGFRRGWMPAHPTVYMRRDVVERTGEFDIAMKIGADYDFMLRAIECGEGDVGLIDRVLVDMQMGGASTSGVRAYMTGNLEALRSRRRWLGSGAVDYALFAKPIGKILQWV